VTVPEKLPTLDPELTRAICNVLGQTEWPGLTGSEIDGLLRSVRADERGGGNKRESLNISLNNTQVRQKAGNAVIAFVTRAMTPSRYAADPQRFAALQEQLNEVLVFFGYRVNDAGRLARTKAASTQTEAAQLAGRLQTELRRRGAHEQLFTYCSEELVSRSLFHAMSEAAKSIPNRVRQMTGLAGDGGALYNGVFGAAGQERPVLTINPFVTESELSEHRGFLNLLIGIHGHYRNPRAHSSRMDNAEDVHDFYDAFSLFSYVHRRLDRATKASAAARR